MDVQVSWSSSSRKTNQESNADMQIKRRDKRVRTTTEAAAEKLDFAKIYQKDRLFAIGIYALMIVVAISLMMLLFNVLIRMQ